MDSTDKIIKECRIGNRLYQRKLYDKYASKMLNLCQRYCRNNMDAEDIIQEGFIKVFNKLNSYSATGSFEGWIRRIMINTALEKYRKQKYLYPVSEIIENNHDLSYDHIIGDISAKDLMKLIQELSPKYRMVFNLYAIEGYSHKEIGDMLNVTVGTSKSNLSRARMILQKRVKQLFLPGNSQLKMAE